MPASGEIVNQRESAGTYPGHIRRVIYSQRVPVRDNALEISLRFRHTFAARARTAKVDIDSRGRVKAETRRETQKSSRLQ